MVITNLEARLSHEQASILKASFKNATKNLDEGILETFLLQNPKDLNQWRIETIWESIEALNEMRKKGDTPRGILMFREAGAEPKLTVFNVIVHSSMKT